MEINLTNILVCLLASIGGLLVGQGIHGIIVARANRHNAQVRAYNELVDNPELFKAALMDYPEELMEDPIGLLKKLKEDVDQKPTSRDPDEAPPR